MTQNFERTRGYFGDAAQVHLPDIFPPFLYREVRRHHGVIACEGSMFKSKFANALTTMMIGSLGIAAAENKVSIGYGAEAGDMDPLLAQAVRALLQPIADPDAQRGLAGDFERARRAQRTGHGHGVDVRAARAGSRAQGARAKPAGTAARRCWWSARSIRSGGR